MANPDINNSRIECANQCHKKAKIMNNEKKKKIGRGKATITVVINLNVY